MRFLQQTWILARKDLLIVGRRSWFTTILRAFVFPVIVTFIVCYSKILVEMQGTAGVQEPSPLMSLHDAFELGTRSKFVVVNNSVPGDDVRAAIDELVSTARIANKNVVYVNSHEELQDMCPASSKGITDCFAGVEFLSSPDQGPGYTWNYTLYYDFVIGDSFNVASNENAVQVYLLPLQYAIDSIITSSHGGPGLPSDIKQFGFTAWSEAAQKKTNRQDFRMFLEEYLAWVFFIGLCGIIYHVTGFITQQREKGLLQLIDAMMPNSSPWQCLATRILSTHLSFDLIYLPGWITMGAITGAFAFPHTGAGWYILVYILAGLALNSYSILASSIFKRAQLGAISAIVAAFAFALAAQFGDAPGPVDSYHAQPWALAILFPPCTFIYFLELSAYHLQSFSIYDLPYFVVLPGDYGGTGAAYLGLFAVQIVVFPVIGAAIEKSLHVCSSPSREVRRREEMGGHSVRLTGLSKHYKVSKKKDKIRAVDDLSLDLHAGSITVLLGTNGSGKSSTLNCIAGFEDITSGRIEIDGTGGIGITPQRNVHWGCMTVEEHVRLFEQLKHPSWSSTQRSQEVDKIVSGCDLDLKKHARAKTLSGGQMRKLQLAMMLAGGSQVCCIDEASCGLDPLSRRRIWDILLRERAQRTMLLTTHFLDEAEVLQLNTGHGCGLLKQIVVLFRKRLTVLKHNFMPYVLALFVPLLVAGMVTRLLNAREQYSAGLACHNQTDEFTQVYGSLDLGEIALGGIFGPPSTVSKSGLKKFIPEYPAERTSGYGYSGNDWTRLWEDTKFVNDLDEFRSYIEEYISKPGELYKWGGFYMGDENVFAYGSGNYGPQPWPLLAQAGLHTLLSNVTFGFSAQSFRDGYLPSDTAQGVVAILTVLGFTLYPGLFALYPTAERLRNVRAMQYSNGVLSGSLWIAYAMFDFIFILIISVFATVIWAACYHGWYALEYVFVVFLLYGMAATAYSYVISLFVKSQLAAMACTTLVQVVIAGLFFVGNYVSVNNAPATGQAAWLSYIYFTIGLICPAVNLFRALLVTLNVYGLACRGPFKASCPGEIVLFGGPILYLILQTLVLVAFLIFWESGRSLESFGLRRSALNSIVEEIDTDVVDDNNHLTLTDDGLHVFNLTKSFAANRAVENVSFGVLASEKLALLGPNGAGKSTAISLIRGELEPDPTDPPGSVYISGDSLMHASMAAKNHLGVCPQFDAIDSMTVSEHLHFYARARGVPDKDSNVRQLIETLGLTDHANKLPKKLPPRAQRCLSLAIALIANPSVLLLDEPSSGMDVASRRALWSILNNISAGRCLLMTTHSMEEAAALCDRAGIMATKMLALGTISDLCNLYGDLVHIHIVHTNAPHSTGEDMERIWRWVKATFIVAKAEERTYGGQLRFAVPIRADVRGTEMADGSDMARLFRIIEYKKIEMGIRDYSISPTTMNQVFLNVVSKHDVVEENTTIDEKSGMMRRLMRRGPEKM